VSVQSDADAARADEPFDLRAAPTASDGNNRCPGVGCPTGIGDSEIRVGILLLAWEIPAKNWWVIGVHLEQRSVTAGLWRPKMNKVDGKESGFGSWCGLVTVIALCFLTLCAGRAAAEPREYRRMVPATATPVIVQPKFGGQIIGYTIDPNGTEGLLSEAVAEANGKRIRVATETFDQTTGSIIRVVAKETGPVSTDYATQEINAPNLGLVLFQEAGQNSFLTLNPLTDNEFNGTWTPTVMSGYGLSEISVAQGTDVAVFENDPNADNAFVFGSNVAENTFGPPMSLASIISVDEFLINPQIALDSVTNEAVLADSHDCPEPEPECATFIALVNLTTGNITEFTDKLGVGQLNGLAVDPVKGIAVTTTLVDQGVEFYNLTRKKGHKVVIPNSGSEIQSGEDVEFDPVHQWFLVSQYTSTGDPNNPQPRIYVYDEAGKVLETVALEHNIGIGGRKALNPNTRTGFVPFFAEPQGLLLELQSFAY
jgi:hypothetical protein